MQLRLKSIKLLSTINKNMEYKKNTDKHPETSENFEQGSKIKAINTNSKNMIFIEKNHEVIFPQ